MIKLSLAILWLMTFLPGWSVISDDQGKGLDLVVGKDRFELENSYVKIKNDPGQLKLTFSFKVASFRLEFAESNKTKLSEIKIDKNTEDVKRIKLIAESFSRKGNNVKYHLAVEVRKACPCIFIEMGLKNLSEEAICGYYFLRLYPMHSEYYVTKNGEDQVRSQFINTSGWIFLPVDNKPDGIGLVYNSLRKNLKFGTNYPHKNWQSAGYYFMSNLKKYSPVPIKKNESNIIKLVIFPAKDEEKVSEQAEQIQKEGFFEIPGKY